MREGSVNTHGRLIEYPQKAHEQIPDVLLSRAREVLGEFFTWRDPPGLCKEVQNITGPGGRVGALYPPRGGNVELNMFHGYHDTPHKQEKF